MGKYMWGYAPPQNVSFDGHTTLVVHEARIHGFGIIWFINAWILPCGALALVFYSLTCLARERIWSFECGAYLRFTWHLPRTLPYKVCVGIMAFAPIFLLTDWFIGAHLFPKTRDSLENNFQVMQSSLLAILLLLFSLNMLAFPSVPVH